MKYVHLCEIYELPWHWTSITQLRLSNLGPNLMHVGTVMAPRLVCPRPNPHLMRRLSITGSCHQGILNMGPHGRLVD